MGPMGLMRLMGMTSGGTKISARKPVATSPPSIAPDLSHACVRHRLDAVANPWRRFYHPGFLNIIRMLYPRRGSKPARSALSG